MVLSVSCGRKNEFSWNLTQIIVVYRGEGRMDSLENTGIDKTITGNGEIYGNESILYSYRVISPNAQTANLDVELNGRSNWMQKKLFQFLVMIVNYRYIISD